VVAVLEAVISLGMTLRTMVVIALVGCGGGEGDGSPDVGGGDCGTEGNGTVTGSVSGAQITPVVRANQVALPGAGVVIVLDEIAGACGMPGNTGEHLVLLFCAAPAPGTIAVVGEQQFSCPGLNASSIVEQNGGMDLAEATGGSVQITSTDGMCTSGSYTLDYGAEQLTGTFNAIVCP
jgi:hypothetical protein